MQRRQTTFRVEQRDLGKYRKLCLRSSTGALQRDRLVKDNKFSEKGTAMVKLGDLDDLLLINKLLHIS